MILFLGIGIFLGIYFLLNSIIELSKSKQKLKQLQNEK